MRGGIANIVKHILDKLDKLNLQARIVIGALIISLIPLFILFFYSVARFENTLKQASAVELKDRAFLAGEVVNHYLSARIGEIKILADSDTLRGKDTPICPGIQWRIDETTNVRQRPFRVAYDASTHAEAGRN